MLCKWIVTWLGFKHCVYRHTHRRWVPRPDNKGWKEAEQENLVRLINPVSPIRTLIQTSPALALKRTGWTCEGSWKVSIKHTFQLNCLSLRRQKNQIIKQEAGWIEHSHVPYAAAQRSTQPGRQGTQSLHYINTVELTPPPTLWPSSSQTPSKQTALSVSLGSVYSQRLPPTSICQTTNSSFERAWPRSHNNTPWSGAQETHAGQRRCVRVMHL